MKSLVKKKVSHHKTKPPPEKLPYEKSEEESKAAAQKNLDNWWKSFTESKTRRLELQKNSAKPHYIAQRELRKKSMSTRKNSVRHVGPLHYRTTNALSTNHIRHPRKGREQGKMLHSSGSNLSNLSTR
jgi:1,2-phenylacetyl-CoA epoxidase catalytic subunit